MIEAYRLYRLICSFPPPSLPSYHVPQLRCVGVGVSVGEPLLVDYLDDCYFSVAVLGAVAGVTKLFASHPDIEVRPNCANRAQRIKCPNFFYCGECLECFCLNQSVNTAVTLLTLLTILAL